MPRPNTNRPDVYTTITDQIVGLLETGVKPWTQPWHAATMVRPIPASTRSFSGALPSNAVIPPRSG